MPILKRRQGQVLLIGPDVKITIIQTQKGAVTLDVEAPPSYKIRRLETTQLEGTNNASATIRSSGNDDLPRPSEHDEALGRDVTPGQSARPDDPKDVQVEIVFDRGGKRYVVRCRKWADWLDNLRAAERTIFYLYRAIDEYGVTTNEAKLGEVFAQIFTAFEATPDDTVLALGSGAEAWWDVLGVKREATKAEVINAYRALAKIHHPDTGGTADTFKRLRRAYEQAVDGR